jgi:hypothetical protein
VKAKKEAIDIRKLVITSYQPGDVIFMDLRFYDGTDAVWFDSLNLPFTSRRYMVKGVVDKLTNGGRKLKAKIGLFDGIVTLDSWDLGLYCSESIGDNILVDTEYLTLYPQIAV